MSSHVSLATPADARGELPVTIVRSCNISVVIPCYQQAHLLAECLDSLRAQTHANWHAIVVDDASPDAAAVRTVVEATHDSRIRIIRHERNRGLAAARNSGFAASKTEFVFTLDADDMLAPSALEQLLSVAANDPDVDLVFSDYRCFGALDEVRHTRAPAPGEILTYQPLLGAGLVVRRQFWARLGGYDESVVLRQGREDVEFLIRAFHDRCAAKHVSEPLYLYRITSDSLNIRCRSVEHVVRKYIYRKHKDLFDAAGKKGEFLAKGYQQSALRSLQEGRLLRSIWLAVAGVWVYPSRHSVRRLAEIAYNVPIFSPFQPLYRRVRACVVPWIIRAGNGSDSQMPVLKDCGVSPAQADASPSVPPQ